VSTSEQRRAADALSKVMSLENESEDLRKRYRAYVDRLGPMIIMNGLGQALATERAAAGENPQKDDERLHMTLYKNISDWICRKPDGVYPGATDLVEALMSNSQDPYLRAQFEVLSWLEWHKRFCRAYLPTDTEAD
jgi:CRISPR type III-B/RAMP module-associated protein Cmr5